MDTETTAKEVKVEFPGLIRVYKDNSVERLYHCPSIPPCLENKDVASKDVTISTSTGLSARLYLPKPNQTANKLPVLVYFHGGGFCTESAFSTLTSGYTSILSLEAQVIVVSVEYRLAPEHPLPTAYQDCWAALNWVASESDSDPWLTDHADLTAVFIGGDSSGANIVHNVAMKAGTESLNKGVEIRGAFLSQGFFLDEKIPELEIGYKIWEFVYPDAPDSWMINPMGDGAPTLAGLGCSKVLVIVASEDLMRGSGVRYYNAVKESGFNGQVELFQVEGEGHGFHVFNPHSQNANLVFQRLASFFHPLDNNNLCFTNGFVQKCLPTFSNSLLYYFVLIPYE